MNTLEFLLASRRWDPICLRANIASPEQIEVFKKTRRAHVESNCLRPDTLDLLIKRTIRELAPEWWEETKVILNRNVTCQRHRDGNDGHSWILWLGDFEGGALVFETGDRITAKGVWHRIDGQVPHWNEPHTGTKYGVVLYQRSGPTKREIIHRSSRGTPPPASE